MIKITWGKVAEGTSCILKIFQLGASQDSKNKSLVWLVHGFHNGKITFFSILTHIIPAFWPRKNQQWNSLISTLIFNWAIPEKIQTRGFEDILFWKTHWNFSFLYFNTGNSRQNKAKPLDIPQNCVRFLENSKAKDKDPWKFHIIFSWSPLEVPLCF